MSYGAGRGLNGVEATPPKTTPPKTVPPVTLVVVGRITRARVPELCAELERLLAAPGRPAAPAVCDLAGVVRPDLTAVEAVARLSLTARRADGGALRLRNVPPELRTLLDLVGLADLMDLPGLADGR
ncbi:lipid asymmetry maintenance protein MlaB [Streptomyces sp. NPDC005576]|uniref:STAS domain-containing protein n=1 Tax=Streptomyces sp. NPDC005576 TaxID=3364726 RepID=UPI00367639B6